MIRLYVKKNGGPAAVRTYGDVAKALDDFAKELARKAQAPAEDSQSEVGGEQVPVRTAIPAASFPGVKGTVFRLKTEEDVPVVKNGKPVEVQATDPKGNKMFTKKGVPIMKALTEKKRLANPILATTVYFDDGTSSTVKNTEHDGVKTEKVRLGDGTETEVASNCSKEAGVVYALVKRAFGPVDEKGKARGGGFGKILSGIVAAGRDQNLDEAKLAAKKRLAKAKAKAKAKAGPEAEEPTATKSKPKGKKKPLSAMNKAERRAYWREAYRRRKANAKKACSHNNGKRKAG